MRHPCLLRFLLQKIILIVTILIAVSACQNPRPDSITPPPPTAPAGATPDAAEASGAEAPSLQKNTPAAPDAPATPTTAPAAAPPASPEPPMPLPTPMTPPVDFYTVRNGDTLGGISYAYDIPLEDLLALNEFESENTVIHVGQTIRVPLDLERTAPVVSILPDSEVVFSPAYLGFDTAIFVRTQGGYLATYAEKVNGVSLSGAEIIDRLARQYSVGPRVLLALLEYYGGWVTNPQPTGDYPLGRGNPYGERLYLQMSWAAAMVNQGYYGYKQYGTVAIKFRNRSRALVPAGMNAGTVGVMNVLAVNSDWETWQSEIGAEGFSKTYRELFGNPFDRAIVPLVPASLTQPPLQLPWGADDTFYFTGGPHEAYGTGSALGALDFGPPDVLGSCYYSDVPLTAAADGRIFLGSKGETYLDLDGDGNLQTGWVLLYLHMAADEALQQGQRVTAGTPLGYASCEGGVADASHLHFARRYNGEWLAADGPVPMVLSGWRVRAGDTPYDGTMVREDEIKTACECWDETNALLGAK